MAIRVASLCARLLLVTALHAALSNAQCPAGCEHHTTLSLSENSTRPPALSSTIPDSQMAKLWNTSQSVVGSQSLSVSLDLVCCMPGFLSSALPPINRDTPV